MRAAVTGATGFLGSNLISRWLKSGTKILAIDIRSEKSAILAEKDVSLVEVDLSRPQDLRLDLRDVDWLVHFASLSSPKTSVAEPGVASADILASKAVFERAIEDGVRRILFPSSGGTIYGEPRYMPIDENHLANPLIPYATAKLKVERMLLDMCRGTETRPVILRYANPYGPNQYFSRGTGVITYWLEAIRDGGQITMFGDGSEARDYFFISDAIDATISVLEIDAPRDIYNIGSGRATSLNELLTAIEVATQLRADVKRLPRRGADAVKAYALDCSRALRDFGWLPKVPLEDGLKRTWEWVKKGEQFQI